MLFFQKKKEKKDSRNIILHLCIKNLDIIYSSWVIEHEGLKLVIVGHFLPFTHLRPQKISFEKMKNLLEISSFYICVPKNHKHMMLGSWDTEWDVQNFLSYWAIFCPFPPPPPQQPAKSKFWKNKKSTCRCRPFTRVYLIWRSNDVWFLRYKAQWTEFFVILGHFLPFYPTKNQENFFLKKWNISLEILSFYSCAS